MFDIGFWELLLLVVIGLLVAGPERLPGMVRDVGRWAAKLRRFAMQTRREFEQQLRLDEVKDFNDKVAEMDDLMELAPDQDKDAKSNANRPL